MSVRSSSGELCSKAGCSNPLPLLPDSPQDSNTRALYHQLTPLSQQRKEIRLLKLLPDYFEEPIRCVLFKTPLFESPSQEATADNDPQFVWRALSHVWGTNPNRKSIYVNNYAINIRVNLWECLFWLRQHGYSDPIWVDALCIDQQNLEERSTQVQMMSSIYQSALETVVYQASIRNAAVIDALTEHKVDTAAFFEDIDVLGGQMFAWYEGTENPVLEAAAHIIDNSTDGSYWTRLWTVQEFVHARTLRFVSGPLVISLRALTNIQKISVQAFARVAHNLQKGEETKGAGRALSLLNGRISRRMSLRENKKDQSILEALTHGRNMACTDPRDCVYSTWSFTPIQHESDLMLADYTLCTPCVWSSVTRHIIQDTGRLDILGNCLSEVNNSHGNSTWIPNWQALPVSIEEHRNYQFSPTIPPRYKFREDSKTLEVQGVIIGSIKEAVMLSNLNKDQESYLSESLCDTCMDLVGELKLYLKDDSKVAACLDDLAILIHETCVHTVQEYQDLKPFFTACLNSDRGMALEKITKVCYDLMTFFRLSDRQRLTLFLTEEDVLLLAVTFHSVPIERALICGLWGCNYPIIVRRDGDGDKIIGPCLVSGLGSGGASRWLQHEPPPSATFTLV